jgi:transcriptional regulator with XRE-family HTH domain
MFNKRLEEYRLKLKIETKREMAKKIGISEQLYAMVERGARKPSSDIIKKLVVMSKLPAEYWLYGVNKNDFFNNKDDLKNIKRAIDTILEFNITDIDSIFDENNNPKDSLGKLLINALKKDINYMIEKK